MFTHTQIIQVDQSSERKYPWSNFPLLPPTSSPYFKVFKKAPDFTTSDLRGHCFICIWFISGAGLGNEGRSYTQLSSLGNHFEPWFCLDDLVSALTFAGTTFSLYWHQRIPLVLFDILLGGWRGPFIIKLNELKWFQIHLNSRKWIFKTSISLNWKSQRRKHKSGYLDSSPEEV